MNIIFLTLLNAVSFLLCILLELRHRSPFTLLFFVLVAIFFIPNTIYLNEIALNEHTHESIVHATIFVTVINFIYFVCRYLLNFVFRKKVDWTTNEEERKQIKQVTFRAVTLSIAGLVMWLVGLLTLKSSFSEITWTDTLNVGIYSSVGNSLLFAGFGSIMLAYVSKQKTLLIVSISLGALSILVLRSRANLIPVIVPFLLLFLFRNNKINFKIKYLFYGVAFVFFVFFLQQFRYLGELSNFRFSDTGLLVEKSFDQMLSKDRGEFTLVNAFYKFVENKNEYPEFEQGNTYRRILLFFIPTSLANATGVELKPRDFAIDMYAAYYDQPDNTIGTMHPTLYGDLYANFGFSGSVIFIVFFTIIIAILFEAIGQASPKYFYFALPSICFFIVFLARGAVYNGIFTLLMTSCLYFIFIKYRLRIFQKASD